MKLLFSLILLFMSCSSQAEDEFIETFDLNANNAKQVADLISQYYIGKKILDSQQAQSELLDANTKLKQLIKNSPNKPILYFIKGLNHSLLASYYKQSANNKFSQELQKKNLAYQKAIQLDKQKQLLLSAQAYATMKHGLPQKYKITAIQKELAQGGSGDNESQYWYLHWSNINSLQQAGRFKDAKKAINNMKKELSDSGPDQSIYHQISTQAEKNLSLAIEQNKPVSTPPSPSKKNQQPSIDTKTLVIVIISVISILAFVGITVYEFKFKKRR